jgi:hypothetical protein
MSIQQDISKMRILLQTVLEQEKPETTNYMNALAAVRLSENFDIDEDNGIQYIVTEGWDNDDEILDLLESAEYEDLLDEGVFSGLNKDIIKNMTGTRTNSVAGENSSTKAAEAKNKSTTHKTIADAMENNHVIVKHNGKVIATSHPAYGGGDHRAELRVTDGNNEQSRSITSPRRKLSGTGKWRNDRYVNPEYVGGHETNTGLFNKGHALEYIHNKIQDAGGYKGHHVEIHIIGKDSQREAKRNERAQTKNKSDVYSNHPRAFQNIAKKAAEKLTRPAIDPQAHKSISDDIASHSKNMKDSMANGNHWEASTHAEKLAKSLKSLHHLTSDKETMSHRQVRWDAESIGKEQQLGRKDATNPSTDTRNGGYEARKYSKSMKSLKNKE